jgi:pimeloyl-ACP methyl ester carboxylesterase
VGSKSEVEDRFLSLGGLKFHYRDWGSTEAPPIVLLHAASLSSGSYDHIAHQLSSSHRVLVVDQRGRGETDGHVTMTGIGDLKMSSDSLTLSAWTRWTW